MLNLVFFDRFLDGFEVFDLYAKEGLFRNAQQYEDRALHIAPHDAHGKQQQQYSNKNQANQNNNNNNNGELIIQEQHFSIPCLLQ